MCVLAALLVALFMLVPTSIDFVEGITGLSLIGASPIGMYGSQYSYILKFMRIELFVNGNAALLILHVLGVSIAIYLICFFIFAI